MESVYKRVLKFQNKYPNTVGWRMKEHCSVVQKHLNPGENIIYAFIAQKNDNPLNIIETAVIALTDHRILIGRKRLLYGYFLTSITPDMFNDLDIAAGLIWGKVHIDTIKELVTLSNIDKRALTEIETEISSFMMEAKKLYKERKKEE